jgi:plasmid stabilization system protein ParE
MRNLTYTNEAQISLKRVAQYLEDYFGKEKAIRYFNEMLARIEKLSTNPKLGKHRPDLGDEVWSYLVHKNVRIYYRYSADTVHVLLLKYTKSNPDQLYDQLRKVNDG